MNHTRNIIIAHAKAATANNAVPVYLECEETGKKLAAIWGNEEQRYANATIWAISPQMYALIKDMAEFYQNTTDENPIARRIREIIKAVEG